MKVSRSICSTAATSLLIFALAVPAVSFAHDQACHPGEARQISQQESARWARNQMDKDAAWLEIKSSQESAWEAYSTANLELLSTFSDVKPLPLDVDAATAIRKHAEHAAAFAQSLSKVADATEKLQAVLNEDQRKVLDRIVRLHSQFQGGDFSDGRECHGHWQHHHEMESTPNASKPSPKATVPAKPKN